MATQYKFTYPEQSSLQMLTPATMTPQHKLTCPEQSALKDAYTWYVGGATALLQDNPVIWRHIIQDVAMWPLQRHIIDVIMKTVFNITISHRHTAKCETCKTARAILHSGSGHTDTSQASSLLADAILKDVPLSRRRGTPEMLQISCLVDFGTDLGTLTLSTTTNCESLGANGFNRSFFTLDVTGKSILDGKLLLTSPWAFRAGRSAVDVSFSRNAGQDVLPATYSTYIDQNDRTVTEFPLRVYNPTEPNALPVKLVFHMQLTSSAWHTNAVLGRIFDDIAPIQFMRMSVEFSGSVYPQTSILGQDSPTILGAALSRHIQTPKLFPPQHTSTTQPSWLATDGGLGSVYNQGEYMRQNSSGRRAPSRPQFDVTAFQANETAFSPNSEDQIPIWLPMYKITPGTVSGFHLHSYNVNTGNLDYHGPPIPDKIYDAYSGPKYPFDLAPVFHAYESFSPDTVLHRERYKHPREVAVNVAFHGGHEGVVEVDPHEESTGWVPAQGRIIHAGTQTGQMLDALPQSHSITDSVLYHTPTSQVRSAEPGIYDSPESQDTASVTIDDFLDSSHASGMEEAQAFGFTNDTVTANSMYMGYEFTVAEMGDVMDTYKNSVV